MNKDNLNDLLKEHFSTRELPQNRVREILSDCEIARSAYRWKRRAIGASSIATAALVALGFFLIQEPPSPAPLPPTATAPPPSHPQNIENHKLVAVMIHSPDCPNSQAMDPVFAELQEQFIDESVLFIKFDFSSDCARHQAQLLSKNLGLEIIYKEYRKTGEIILVSSCGKVRGVVDRGESIADATLAIRENLNDS